MNTALAASAVGTAALHLRGRVTDAYLRDPDRPSVCRLCVGRPYPVATGRLVVTSTQDRPEPRRYAVTFLGATPADDIAAVLGARFSGPAEAAGFRDWLVRHWTPARSEVA